MEALIEGEWDGDLPLSERQSFGSWLIAQAGRTGWIGKLAASAAGDRGLPRNSSVEQMRVDTVVCASSRAGHVRSARRCRDRLARAVKIQAFADPRDAVATLAARKGDSLAALSRMLNRGPRYLDRFVREKRPHRLTDDEQLRLADYFGADAQDFGSGQVSASHDRMSR